MPHPMGIKFEFFDLFDDYFVAQLSGNIQKEILHLAEITSYQFRQILFFSYF